MAHGKLFLHEAMAVVLLKRKKRTDTIEYVANKIKDRGLYTQRSGRAAPLSQIRRRARKYPQYFDWLPPDQVRLK